MLRRIALLLSLLLLSGCGESEAPPPTSEEVGSLAKQQVLDFTALASEDTELAREQLPVLMESLEAYAENTVGPQKLMYAKLRNSAKELSALYQSEADSSEVEAKLDELAKTAHDLPGSTSQLAPEE